MTDAGDHAGVPLEWGRFWLSNQMKKEFEVIEKQRIYSGFIKLDRYRLRHASFKGGMCPEVVREQIAGLNAVSVLPYDPRRDEVVLVEQFRVGVLDDPKGPWLLETIGGYRPAEETVESVAGREAMEEAGLSLSRLAHIGAFYVSPGLSTERVHLLCAEVDAGDAGGIHGLPEEGEETRVVVMPAEEAINGLFGSIQATTAIISLQWLAANRQRLQHAWGTGIKDPDA